MAAPMGRDRFMFVNPAADAALMSNLKGLFNDVSAVAKQYKSGSMTESQRTIGFNFEMDQNIYVHTVGTLGGTPTTNGVPANGATTVITQSWTTTTLNAGDVFSFVSSSTPVNWVNPESYSSTGQTAQFVVTATTSDSGGAITIPFAPAIYSTGNLQNVTNLPATTTPIYVFDTPAASFSSISAKVSPQNIACHKDFGTLAMVDLPLPGGTDKAYRAASKKSWQVAADHSRLCRDDGSVDSAYRRALRRRAVSLKNLACGWEVNHSAYCYNARIGEGHQRYGDQTRPRRPAQP